MQNKPYFFFLETGVLKKGGGGGEGPDTGENPQKIPFSFFGGFPFGGFPFSFFGGFPKFMLESSAADIWCKFYTLSLTKAAFVLCTTNDNDEVYVWSIFW